MSDESIQMCGEHKEGRGYCQRLVNHVGLHLFPPMKPHIYNQEEVDALIAGAYLACAERIKAIDKDRRQYTSSWEEGFHDALIYMEKDIQKLAPDAAERIAEAVMAARERARAAFHKRAPNGECLCPVCTKDFDALVECAAEAEMEMAYEREHRAAREAKLIADTRLEEAEWWADGHHGGSSMWVGCPCPQCERLAAHRAAVQEGK